MALVFIALGFNDVITVELGGFILGLAGAALPTLAQPFMRKITGSDDIAMGHFNLIGYTLTGYIGKLFASKDQSKNVSDA